MPEFRFRRKKKQQKTNRRHTVHDPEEAHVQVAAAREMVNREEVRCERREGDEGGREGGRGRGREGEGGGGRDERGRKEDVHVG